jgi:hypothetical protein
MKQVSAFVFGQSQNRGLAVGPSVLLATFAAALFLSALMLFSVQPLFAKMALPKLGGAPAVWAVSMCFFQTMLLAGYCYAHLLNRWLSPSRAVLFHLGLLAGTALALPIGLPSTLPEPPEGDAYLWLLGVLALGVGLPFFAVSANAPLLQAWFARTGHADAKDPYFLYGASNLGSLIALLAYPLLIEPQLGLRMQSWVWAGGFGILALCIAGTGLLMLNSAGVTTPERSDAVATRVEVINWSQRAVWVALAAVPSALMVAVTTYITTDIGSAPFLWVIPLAMFLLTFIVVFKDKLSFPYVSLQIGLPLSIAALMFVRGHIYAVLLALSAFFMAALICHRELFVRRPAARSLTEFYIWMSVGGVIGGIAAALVAPQVFTSVIEFKLLVTLALLFCPGVLLTCTEPMQRKQVLLFGTAIVVLLSAISPIVTAGIANLSGQTPWVIMLVGSLGLFLTRKLPEQRTLLAIAAVTCVALKPDGAGTLHQERSFFGTNRVVLSSDGRHRMMQHGTTLHGAQRIVNDDGTPVIGRPPAATYYYTEGAMPRGLELARASVPGKPISVAVLGLGTGALACYAKAGENWKYYEIDPMVARIARNPKLFNMMDTCLPGSPIVIGDARIMLRAEPDAAFNYMLIDAFSSDAIPVHLMTKEAIEGYFAKLAPGGVIGVHISNRFLDLTATVAATVAQIPGVYGVDVHSVPKTISIDAQPSQIIFLSKDPARIAEARAWSDSRPLDSAGGSAWTDDYSDILPALMSKMR